MNRGNMLRLLVALVLVALGTWLATQLEWTDVQVRRPAQGEAATNPLYATQHILSRLGMTVMTRQSLDTLPPPNARLVLSSRHWFVLPGRKDQLRHWVEQGGHLVIPTTASMDDAVNDWVPLQTQRRTAKEKAEAKAEDDDPALNAQDSDDGDAVGDSPPAKPPAAPKKSHGTYSCRVLTETAKAASGDGSDSTFHVCNERPWLRLVPKPGVAALWRVDGPLGTEAVRVAVGKGTVTAFADWPLLNNERILKAEHAPLAMAVLQARTGGPIWFVTEETRPPLLRWLWDRAWPAIILGVLGLLTALWRGAVRFGPMIAPAAAARRSMAEQVRGTGEFLHHHGRAALHVAQQRALDEMAARQIPSYRPMEPLASADAIAQATALPAEALRDALATRKRRAAELAADLDLMETARRRLDANGPFLPRASSPTRVADAPPSPTT